MEMIKVEKVKGLTFDFESQTLTGFIFECNLNFRKMNVDSWLRRSTLVNEENMVKSQNVDFWLKFDFNLNGEMTILPFD